MDAQRWATVAASKATRAVNGERLSMETNYVDDKPRPIVLWNGGTPELWLCKLDHMQTYIPVGSTGPIKMPSDWIEHLKRATAQGGGKGAE